MEIIPLTSIGLISVSYETIAGDHSVYTASEMHNSLKKTKQKTKNKLSYLVRDRQVRYLPQSN